MENRTSPESITTLEIGQCFVFGSNLSGVHGAGAAKLAYDEFGAEWGIGVGFTGRCYAIPSKDHNIRTMSVEDIRPYVQEFIERAKATLDTTFLVTQIGCGLAGYTPEDIAPLFKDAVEVENIHLPEPFWKCLLS